MKTESLWTDADQRGFEDARLALADDDLAAALLAVEGADADTAEATYTRLATWTEALHSFPHKGPPAVQAAVLRRVLAEKEGLTGEVERYYEPRCCWLSDVVARGRGMPILVSSVWIIVGTGAGIPVRGVGLPGHFIARVGEGAGQLVDPFADGRPLTSDHCRSLVRRMSSGQVEWRDDFLASTGIDDLLARVIRNLQLCYARNKDDLRHYRAARLAAKLFPERVAFQAIHAQAAETIEAIPMAIALYRDLADRFPDQRLARFARERLEILSDDAPLVH
jgi:regulator of sirC expression with transglutaminase-like and TPR domain